MVKGALATYGYNDQENKIINLTEIADEKNVREKRTSQDFTAFSEQSSLRRGPWVV
jgi:hypothetical protein